MARNEFRLRGALGGLMAADEDLLAKETQKLENQNKALRAVALADQVRRDRAFAARERATALAIEKEKLKDAVRDNRLDDMLQEKERKTKLRADTAKAEQEEIKSEAAQLYGVDTAEAKLESERAGTAWKQAQTAAVPIRAAAADRSSRASMISATASRDRAAVDVAAEGRRATESNLRIQKLNQEILAKQRELDAAPSVEDARAYAQELRDLNLEKAKAENERILSVTEKNRRTPTSGMATVGNSPNTANRAEAAGLVNSWLLSQGIDIVAEKEDDPNYQPPSDIVSLMDETAAVVASMDEAKIPPNDPRRRNIVLNLIAEGAAVVDPGGLFGGPKVKYLPSVADQEPRAQRLAVALKEAESDPSRQKSAIQAYLNVTGQRVPRYIRNAYPGLFQ